MNVFLAESIVSAHTKGRHLSGLDQSVDGHPGYTQKVRDLIHGQQPSLAERFSAQGGGIVGDEATLAIAPKGR